MKPLIALQNVSFAYRLPDGQRVPALRDVSLRIAPGEYVAVVGANGSGKSTLARHLNALLTPDSGTVAVKGLDTRDPTAHSEVRRTIGMVFQQPEDQIVATVVEDDVAFGLENLGVPPGEIRARVWTTLEEMDLWKERLRPPHLLSAGQQQRLALAGVLAMRPRCIVFDEVTAMLDPAGRREVRSMMRRLHREGLTVVAVTHFMEEVLDAERVIVLQEGRVAADTTPAALFADAGALEALNLALPPAAALGHFLQRHLAVTFATPPLTVPALVEALDARLRRPAPSPASLPAQTWETPTPPPRIEVQGLGHIYLRGTPLARRALRDVGLRVDAGHTHGLLGATGSGKSTLLQHLNGLLRPQEGTVCVAGYDLNDPAVDIQAVRCLAGLVFQMPEVQIFKQYVGDEIAYGPRLQGLEGEALRERVRWAMSLVGLDFETFKDRLTFALSGGEQRKVALASILALQPEILLLDEPTAGLDPASHRELLDHLQALSDDGMTLVLSSHQMDDLGLLTDHLTALAEGTSVLTGSTAQVFGCGEQLRTLGLGQPVVTAVAEGLRARGWLLPVGIVRRETLLAHLRASLEAR
ncbi:MAG: energy-coupling factor transporter ATPase [Anaerolineae bacterium]